MEYIRKYIKLGHSKDMALRVYTTRLLGRNKELVLHGGGNTSVKIKTKDIDGKIYDVLCVKGSGWDMAEIEPQGLPAVKLNPLLSFKNKKYLSDDDMVSFQKRNLIKMYPDQNTGVDFKLYLMSLNFGKMVILDCTIDLF